MTRSYFDYVATGELDKETAARMSELRETGRSLVDMTARTSGPEMDGVAFGMLDALAVTLVRLYGPEQTAEVFRHYATVAGRQADPRTGVAS